MNTEKSLAVFIREKREESGLSMGQLAKGLGVTPTFISDIERGYSKMKIERVPRLAQLLKVSVEEIDALLAAEKGSVTVPIKAVPPNAYGAVAMLGRGNQSPQFWNELLELIEKHKGKSSL